jgi:hypothetical protein
MMMIRILGLVEGWLSINRKQSMHAYRFKPNEEGGSILSYDEKQPMNLRKQGKTSKLKRNSLYETEYEDE